VTTTDDKKTGELYIPSAHCLRPEGKLLH
jgi:hypothetical protein